MAVIGRWEIFTRNGWEARNGVVGFIMRGWEIFKVSLHSWQKGGILFLWLNGWSYHIWYAILFNGNMDIHMLSLATLVPEGPWCVFYATWCQVYWGLTHNVVFNWYFHLISHTNTHTTHSGASRLTHSYKYTFTPPAMCSQQLPLLH